MSSNESWPDSTFVWETDDQEHHCGSHWDAFYDSPDEALRTLPDILPRAMPLMSFGDTYSGPHKIPGSWARGAYLAGPTAKRGLLATLRTTDSRSELINVSPFTEYGIQVGIEIRRVHVWSSGAEAQIEGIWGDAAVSFFDLTFLRNRSWYAKGRRLDFILAGIAYKAAPASVEPLVIAPDSALADRMRDELGIEDEGALELDLDGSGIFAPIEDWDRDDYWFRGPVRTVEAFEDWLGQSGWRVRVCVMRMDTEDAELDVFVTSRAWSGDQPPQVGEDIEGTLWLQGRLWWIGQSDT